MKELPVNPKNLLFSLLDNMEEAVWVGDKNEFTVFVNKRYCELLGYEIEEILGWKSYKFWDDESIRIVEYINNNHRKRGVASSYKGKLKTKNGLLIPVKVNGAPLSNGGTVGIITKLEDGSNKNLKQILKYFAGYIDTSS